MYFTFDSNLNKTNDVSPNIYIASSEKVRRKYLVNCKRQREEI